MSANRWSKVDPDSAVDYLPHPYRLIAEVVEDVLGAVEDRICELEAQRKSEAYEVGLRRVAPTVSIPITGRVTCSHVEPLGKPWLTMGTSAGEVLVFDGEAQALVLRKRVLPGAVSCVSVAADGSYPLPAAKGQPPVGRPPTQVLVAGPGTDKVLVYGAGGEGFRGLGLSLWPACALQLPPQGGADAGQPAAGVGRTKSDARPVTPAAEGGLAGPSVVQLHARGTVGALWVVVLLSDRRLLAYLCPLGAPEAGAREAGDVSQQVIQEGDEEDESSPRRKAAPSVDEEFRGCGTVVTAAYSLALPTFALAGLPEPPLHCTRLSVFSVKPATVTAAAATPLLTLMASSSQSNCLAAYGLEGPAPPAPPAGLGINELLRAKPPAPGTLDEPKETRPMGARRVWALPAKTTAVAVTTDGGLFAAGGSTGTIALVDVAAGPALGTMLPGHYAAVAAMAFHRKEVLVSVGADSWVHHYCMHTDTCLCRFLCSPPPTPPPATAVAASQVLPLAVALDAAGGLKLLDVRRGHKIAQLLTGDEAEGDPAAGPCALQPRQVFSSAVGFFALCEPARPPSAEATEADAAKGEEKCSLAFFDQSSLLKGLFPGLAARVGAESDHTLLARFFSSFSVDELRTKDGPRYSLNDSPPALGRPGARAGAEVTQKRASTLAGSSRRASRSPTRPHELDAVQKTASGASADSQRSQHPRFDVVAPASPLTAENLRSMGRGSLRGGDSATLSKGLTASTSYMTSGREDAARLLLFALEEGHAHPEDWQAPVLGCLRGGLADRERRQKRMAKRMEQLKKEVGDS